MTQLTLFSDLSHSATANPDHTDLDTLARLAILIRDGRAQSQAQAQRRHRPIQSIGNLAQSVLLRHDLVARRRAAAVTRLPMVELEISPAPVQVAT